MSKKPRTVFEASVSSRDGGHRDTLWYKWDGIVVPMRGVFVSLDGEQDAEVGSVWLDPIENKSFVRCQVTFPQTADEARMLCLRMATLGWSTDPID